VDEEQEGLGGFCNILVMIHYLWLVNLCGRTKEMRLSGLRERERGR
jgi:hypothetical protein